MLIASQDILFYQTLAVRLEGVADFPTFANSTSGEGWTSEVSGSTTLLSKAFAEDEVIVLDLEVASGESPSKQATDTSESLTVIIALPASLSFVDASVATFIGTNSRGEPEFEVAAEDMKLVHLETAEHQTADIVLDARVVVTEDDGDSVEQPFTIRIDLAPVIDADDYTGNLTSSECDDMAEDTMSRVYILPTDFSEFEDTKEEIVGVAFAGLPTGYQAFYDGALLTPSSGFHILDPSQVNGLVNEDKPLEILSALHSDENVELTVTVTIKQDDMDGEVTAMKDIQGTILVKLRAIVEDDGVLEFRNSEGVRVDVVQAEANNMITLGEPHLVFDSADTSSDEVIMGLVLQFPDSIANLYLVEGAAYDGKSRWIVTDGRFDTVKIRAIAPVDNLVEITAFAQVADLGDLRENDISCEKVFNTTLMLNYSLGDGSCTDLPGDVTVAEVVISGQEDTVIDFGNQLLVSVDPGYAAQDQISIRIPKETLESFPVIDFPGGNYDFESGNYIFRAPVNADGTTDLSGLTMIPPENYAGDFQFDFIVSNFDTMCSGVLNYPVSVKIEIDPVAENPGVVSLELLTAAVEDQSVDLRLSIDGMTDLDPPTLGEERLTTFSVSSSTGETTILSIDNEAGIVNLRLTPSPDFSGEVIMNLRGAIQDQALFDIGGSKLVSDTVNFAETVSLNVDYACDDVSITVPASLSTSEGTPLNLEDIDIKPEDVDGSEKLVSAALSGVPRKFLINGGAQNVGFEQWLLNTPTGDLTGLSVSPPEYFSGSVTVVLTANVKEDLAPISDVCVHPVALTLTVEPIADELVEAVLTRYNGREGSDIELTLDLAAQDNAVLYPTLANVVENPPETIRATFANVPINATIAAPLGATVMQLDETTWQVDSSGATLSSVTFNPGSATGAFELHFTAISIDNGVELTSDLAVVKALSFDISSS